MDTNISLGLNIKTKVRIQVLYDVIKELCGAFDFPESTINILHKGIVERQILACVYAHYLDASGKSVGLVRFNIDWKKHKMYAATSTGGEIEIYNDRPLIEQFAMWSTDIIEYVKIMQKEFKVKKVDVYFRYTEEIQNDPIADKEADEFLGLGKSTNEIKFSDEKAEGFERKMKFISEILPELEIEIQSKSHS